MNRVSNSRVIEEIHGAGGVTSLAHPGRIRAASVRPLFSELAENDLDAIGVWYPYGDIQSDDYADVDVEAADSLVSEYGLLKTGGSDCHDPDSGKFCIGTVGVSEQH